MKYPLLLWLVVLALGGVFCYLFFGESIGTNYAAYTFLWLAGGFIVLLVNGKKPARKSLWLVAPFAFFAVVTFTRQEPLTLFFAYALTIFSLGLLAITYLSGRWMQYSLTDYFSKFCQLANTIITFPEKFFGQTKEEQAEIREAQKKSSLSIILRGFLIILPAAGIPVFVIVFSNPASRQTANIFIQANLWQFIFFLAFWLFPILFWSYLLAGTYLHAAFKSQDENLSVERKTDRLPFLNFNTTAIILGSAIVLLLSFIIVKFHYFFGVGTAGGFNTDSYGEYARNGLIELTSIAVFSLFLIRGLNIVSKCNGNHQKHILSGLSCALICVVMIILISAYQRVGLAIEKQGFYRLWVDSQVLLVWEGILLAVTAFLVILQKERYFGLTIVLCLFGFGGSLSVINVDDWIVRNDIQRASQGNIFNPEDLASLSLDAVPALVKGYSDPSLPTPVHDAIGTALICYPEFDHLFLDEIENWRSFNLSKWNAIKTEAPIQEELMDYHTSKSRNNFNYMYECPRDY